MSSILACLAVLLVWLWAPPILAGDPTSKPTNHIWKQITAEAKALGLPTKFLQTVPADFVRFEFDDLQAFAAEYHPSEHRMVLNRTLSFNVAGGTLRPLARLTHAELETLYHELFHAYMDYLETKEAEGEPDAFLSFARRQQRCRYGVVLITPVVQRKMETEERFLSERESWEALNEGWAVFVGWTVWTQLEMRSGPDRPVQKPNKQRDAWLRRLEEADRDGKLRGYYEPEDPAERSVTRKRFLAPGSRLSIGEIERLMSGPLEFPADLVKQAGKRVAGTQHSLLHAQACDKNDRSN
ncbi:MAG TPA: hypothetical protein VH681_04890 [Nitrospiraceae bacterium]